MGHLSKTFDNAIIKKMRTHYKNYLGETPNHAIFLARTPHAVITAYKSGKVLFQGNNPKIEADKWDPFTDPRKKNRPVQQKPAEFLDKNHIGSDESGTGDYFGPITTCAVYVQKEQIELLKEIGIQDSKAITDKKIKELSKYLIDMDIPYSLMILHNEKYNALQKRGWSQGKMKTMLHHACIESLLNKIGDAMYEGILIDQFCQPNIYKRHLASEGNTIPMKTHFMTKAETYSIAVAAGSIIARASFVQEMDRLSSMVGVPLLKGASKKVDQLAARIIREQGESALEGIAKVHFANTGKARGMI